MTNQHNGISFNQVEEVQYTRKFIDYEHQPLYKHVLELYGIKDECCKDNSNICYTESNEFVKCKVCNRLFKWSRKTTKVSWREEHITLARILIVSGFIIGGIFAYYGGLFG